jgi:hypothetical protein
VISLDFVLLGDFRAPRRLRTTPGAWASDLIGKPFPFTDNTLPSAVQLNWSTLVVG